MISIEELSIFYVKNTFQIKRFNLQGIAINEFLKEIDELQFKESLRLSFKEFNKVHYGFSARDLVIKNDSFSTRNSILISSSHYFYYTNLIIKMMFKNNLRESIDFSSINKKIYYSGILERAIKSTSLNREILFDSAYRKFQDELKKNNNKQAMLIDLQSFFDSISTKDLIEKLAPSYETSLVNDLKEFLEYHNFHSVPQLHYSIASSILSQLFLKDFDEGVNELLKSESLEMIRFVDDMFFINNGDIKTHKDFVYILEKINKLLWIDNLNINLAKLKFFVDEKFEIDFSHESYDDTYINTEEKFENKCVELVNGGFNVFVIECNELYEEKGYDAKAFNVIFKKHFSVEDEDARKILNKFLFNNHWEAIDITTIREMVINYKYVFFLPSVFITLYLKMYNFYENKMGRDEVTIRDFLKYMNGLDSLKKIEGNLTYLIQRNFKKRVYIDEIKLVNKNLDRFINKEIIEKYDK